MWGVFVDTGFIWLALVLLAFSFFWNSSLPLFEAMTLNHLGDDEHKYSVVRLWGSLGFIMMVVLLGEYFDLAGIDQAPVVIIVLLAGILLVSLIPASNVVRLTSAKTAAPPRKMKLKSGFAICVRKPRPATFAACDAAY